MPRTATSTFTQLLSIVAQWRKAVGQSVAQSSGTVSGAKQWESQWRKAVGESVAQSSGRVSGVKQWESQWCKAVGESVA